MSSNFTKRQQEAMSDEFSNMMTTGIHYGLIPENISEIEFDVNMMTGQVAFLEYWSSSARKPEEITRVQIPASLLDKFNFTVASEFLRRGCGE